MNALSASTWIKAVFGNYYVSSILFFALFLAALMSGSVLAILAGLVLYVRPLLYIKAINSAVGLVSATFEGKAVAGSNKRCARLQKISRFRRTLDFTCRKNCENRANGDVDVDIA